MAARRDAQRGEVKVPAWVDRVEAARELRRVAAQIDRGGGPVHIRGPAVVAARSAADALWAARREGADAARLAELTRATVAARRDLEAVFGRRGAWLIVIEYLADRAKAATDPAECAVLDADVRMAWEAMRREWAKQQGRDEERVRVREPRLRGACVANAKKRTNYATRNAALLDRFESLVGGGSRDIGRAESAPAYKQIASKANVTVKRAREIIAEAREARGNGASR